MTIYFTILYFLLIYLICFVLLCFIDYRFKDKIEFKKNILWFYYFIKDIFQSSKN